MSSNIILLTRQIQISPRIIPNLHNKNSYLKFSLYQELKYTLKTIVPQFISRVSEFLENNFSYLVNFDWFFYYLVLSPAV